MGYNPMNKRGNCKSATRKEGTTRGEEGGKNEERKLCLMMGYQLIRVK